jgi:hypothetical protein
LTGIGIETSNFIDNVLIFGAADPDLREYYQRLVAADQYYGADNNYSAAQHAYLEGDRATEAEQFLALLKNQRQRLFFIIPPELTEEMKLWELTTFHHAGEYLDKVQRVLLHGEKVGKEILDRLARGLNRIFTGLLANNHLHLIVATSGNHSQARISRVFEDTISVQMKRGERVYVALSSDLQKPELVVSVSNDPALAPVRLVLNLTRYEYLTRIAEGALPNSFSRECYEDLLAFKTRILRQLRRRRQIEGDEEDRSRLTLKLLGNPDADGLISDPHSLEVRLG